LRRRRYYLLFTRVAAFAIYSCRAAAFAIYSRRAAAFAIYSRRVAAFAIYSLQSLCRCLYYLLFTVSVPLPLATFFSSHLVNKSHQRAPFCAALSKIATSERLFRVNLSKIATSERYFESTCLKSPPASAISSQLVNNIHKQAPL
jgi:hypothetical protein